MAREFRSGVPAVQAVAPPRTDEPRTYVILGVARGGTSMVAGLTRMCGVWLGDDLPHNHEDAAFNVDQLKKAGADPVARMREAITERDAARDVWGWKYPHAGAYLEDLRDDLRNPHLVVVLRDPVASTARNILYNDAEPLREVLRVHRTTTRNLDLVERWAVPTLFVSYERGLARPFKLAGLLAEFLGTPAPTDRAKVREFVQPGSYQDLPE